MKDVIWIDGTVEGWRRSARRVIKLLKSYRGVPIKANQSDLHKAVQSLEEKTIIRKRHVRLHGSVRKARNEGCQPASLFHPASSVWYCLLDTSRHGSPGKHRLIRLNETFVCPDSVVGQRAVACWYARKLADILEESMDKVKQKLQEA